MDLTSREAFMKGWVEWFWRIDSGDIAEFHFDRTDWIKILGLPPELWSEENFTAIAMTYGQVVVLFAMDQTKANLSFGKVGILTSSLKYIYYELLVEVNGKIIKIIILEDDLDWVSFKSQRYQLDKNSSSDDDGNDEEGGDDEDGISETTISKNNNELEEGEIGTMDVDMVMESNRECSTNKLGEHQGLDGGTNVQLEVETLGSKENINATNHADLDNNTYAADAVNKSVGPGGSPNGLLNKLAKSDYCGPFTDIVYFNDRPTCGHDVNFDSAQDKRRRLIRKHTDTPIDSWNSTSPHSSLDLKILLIPTHVPLPEIEVDSPSSSSEIRNTVDVGNILGFEVDVDNPILEDGENQMTR
ncbi:unnamed protein product [Lactuca saligna]|uniref:DUF4283 domain-containing protein n=1 Tax=Lactuca saligna TaxID=75948 RepID=A0AA36E8J3_LACSI|nr:unnamed protein product [Lactuca saligna]